MKKYFESILQLTKDFNLYSEAKRAEEVYNANKSKISKEDFDKLVTIDTSPHKGYLGWLVQRFTTLSDADKEKMLGEDIEKWRRDVAKYEKAKLKNKLPEGVSKNIFDIKSYKQLYQAVKDFKETEVMSPKEYSEKGVKEEYKTVFEDDKFKVFIPQTYKASCELGKGANWCTAADSKNGETQYNNYTKGGPLYIVIKKGGKSSDKWQFHFHTVNGVQGGAMDSDDNPIKPTLWASEQNISDTMAKFFNRVDPKKQFKNINKLTGEDKIHAVMQIYNVTKYKINSDGSVDVLQDLIL